MSKQRIFKAPLVRKCRFAMQAFGRSWWLAMPLLCIGCGVAPNAARPVLSGIERGRLENSLRADVTALASGIGPRALGHGHALTRAADWTAGRLTAAGWPVKRQSYRIGRHACDILVAERRGKTLPDEIVVVGAHYDTVPGTPGADDNASGVAALLALAGRLSNMEPARTLRFVAFPNEEPPYFHTDQMGSLVYARTCRDRGERIVAMLCLESLGYYSGRKGSQQYPFPVGMFYPSTGDFVAVVGNRKSRSLVRRVAGRLERADGLRVEVAALPDAIPGVGFSDHWSFWQCGYPAVMVTNTAMFRNPHYHRGSDSPETLDYRRFADVVAGLDLVVRDLAAR